MDAWNPQQYDKFKNERSQPAYDLLDLVQPVANANAVDLGCGTGEYTAALHKELNARQTAGLDSSGEMLKKAAGFAGGGLSFSIGDINTFDHPQAYDVIYSNAALQWCANHPDLFRRLHNSLKPGGQLAVQMPMNPDSPTHVLATPMGMEDKWRRLIGPYRKDEMMLKVEEYASLMFALGFREQRVFLNVYGHVLESREGVIEWVKGTLLTYFKSRLCGGDYDIFLEEFRERLFRELPDDRPFFYPFKRVFIWARA